LRGHPQLPAYVALVSVCFFWGTTYLAIRMALEGFPPLVLIAARFVVSGALMLGLVRWRGYALPGWREAVRTGCYGVLILGVGNGCLTYSEKLIPSFLAALFISISPFWMVGIEAAIPGGERLRLPTIAGMLIGFGGAGLLFAPDLVRAGFQGAVWQGFLLLQLGSASWSLGSILQKRQKSATHPFVNGGIQQLAAGLAFLPAALLMGEAPVEWEPRAVGALLWLVVFGSIVGYSSYIFALENLPVALVSIYTYVNPVVAAALGWLVYREPFGGREALAMAIIFVGVAVVKWFSAPAGGRRR
jgi:drug/metabolite transporter (DMT)-like permease